METLKFNVLVVLAVGMGAVGCARHTTVAQRPLPRAPSVPAEWGAAADGLQCRLRPLRRACPAGEKPAFKVDLRNQGGRLFTYLQGEQAPLDRFAVDGCWRLWPDRPPTNGRILPLAPGIEFLELPATLPADAQSHLTPGPHVIQVAFSFEGIEVVSNPVEIEIVGSR